MSGFMKIIITWAVFYAVWYALNAIGYMGQFKKAGISTSKAFIPFVREMETYKMAWNRTNMGLIWLVCYVLGAIALIVGSTMNIQICAWIGFILLIAGTVLQVIRDIKQAKCFHRGGGMAVALVLVNPIANVVLGRTQTDYLGAK